MHTPMPTRPYVQRVEVSTSARHASTRAQLRCVASNVVHYMAKSTKKTETVRRIRFTSTPLLAFLSKLEASQETLVAQIARDMADPSQLAVSGPGASSPGRLARRSDILSSCGICRGSAWALV